MVDLMASYDVIPHRVGNKPQSLNVLWGDMHVKACTQPAVFNQALWQPLNSFISGSQMLTILNLMQP